MAIKSIRIDDRLIHGQVASSWLRYVGAEQILCISDRAAKNPVQEQVLKMAAPGYIVHVFGVDKFIRIYQKNPIKKSTFLITDSTSSLLKMKEGGVEILVVCELVKNARLAIIMIYVLRHKRMKIYVN